VSLRSDDQSVQADRRVPTPLAFAYCCRGSAIHRAELKQVKPPLKVEFEIRENPDFCGFSIQDRAEHKRRIMKMSFFRRPI
jgi:hypothetical protein